ncbi:MAG: hypothetical protein QOF60_788, partial [Actinomycetota bacterium]|nr:hypothetical protein [Actinomycetota bacterium]
MSRRLLAASALVAALLAVVTLPALAQPAPTPTVAIDTFRTLRAGGCANPGDNFDLVAGGTSNQTTVTLSLYSPSGAFLTSGSGTTSSGRWSANFVFNYTQTGLYE